eukprot:6861859-Prymnesium_polylepis.2
MPDEVDDGYRSREHQPPRPSARVERAIHARIRRLAAMPGGMLTTVYHLRRGRSAYNVLHNRRGRVA